MEQSRMNRKIALIYNPAAGRGKALRKKKKVETYLKAQNIPYKLFVTQSEAHLVETTAHAVHSYPVIIGAGGDTTITLIANQILRYKKGNTLGIISLGSVNDLAREIGVLKLEHACYAIKKGRDLTIDVGVVNSSKMKEPFFFLVQASLGLGVAVNRYVEGWLNKHTFFSRFFFAAQPIAAMSGFYHSYKHKIVPVNLNLKQQEITSPIFSPFVIFSNTSIFAREFRLSPYASLIDGKLDCCVLNAATFPHFLNALIQVKRQTHLENKKVEVFQDNTFKVYAAEPLEIQVDGEIYQLDGEIEISIMPRALKLIVNPDFSPKSHLAAAER